MSQKLAVPSQNFKEVSRLGCLEKFISIGGPRLTVVHRYDLDENAGTARAVLGTEDGRHVDVTSMHLGEESGERVYFELWRDDGSGVHGWADAESRRIVQVG